MAYIINKTDGSILTTVEDGTINSETSLTLVGKNYSGYGEFLNENFIRLLENGANSTPPDTPLTGELWYDLNTGALKVWSGSSFKDLAVSVSSPTPPETPSPGELWWDSQSQQVKIWNGTNWIVVGPSYSTETGVTGAITTVIQDTFGNDHVVLKFYVGDQVIAIMSKSPQFTPNPAIPGFTTINPGLNFALTVGGETTEIDGIITQARKLIDPNDQDAVTNTLTNVTVHKNLVPDSHAVRNLGTSDLRWNTIHGTTINGTTINGTTINGTNATFSGTITGQIAASNLTGVIPDARIAGPYTGLGTITPSATTTHNLGSTSLRWDTVFATTFDGTATTALYADLAEKFIADAEYAPGTLVEIGGQKEVTMCNEDACENVFGVVSTDPAYLMNAGSEGVAVALNGRVPVRVVGKVKKGDRLVSAGNGCARAAKREEWTAFNVIGRALEDKNSKEEGLIEAAVVVK